MKHRVGVKLIARQAGVSTATVDRVLNQRPGISVKPATVKKVLDAVSMLNAENAAQLTGEPCQKSFSFALLVQSGAGFNTRLQQSLYNFQSVLSVHQDVNIQASFTTDLNSDTVAQQLLELGQNSDGVILACQETPVIRDVIQQLAEQDHPVVCITTDLPNSKRLAFVGMDQYRAGRVAGTLIGRFSCQQPGEVLFIVSGNYRCQQEREIGFRQVLRESFPHLSVSESLQSGDANEISYQQAKAFLADNKPPLAIYNVSGGNQGILQALAECEILEKTPVYVCHDLTPNTRRSLIEGKIDAVIDYDATDAINQAVQHLISFHQSEYYNPESDPLAIRICMADTV